MEVLILAYTQTRAHFLLKLCDGGACSELAGSSHSSSGLVSVCVCVCQSPEQIYFLILEQE